MTLFILTFLISTALQADEPLFDAQWALKNSGQFIKFDPKKKPGFSGKKNADIRSQKAWSIQSDCSSVLVGIIDSGVDLKHPDLVGNLKPEFGANFIDFDTPEPIDRNGHGTHVAGIVAAQGNNQIGVSGVCQKAAIIPIKVCDANGACPGSSILEGLSYATQLASVGLRVVNVSFGGLYPIHPNLDDPYENWFYQELKWQEEAIRQMNDAGILVVAAAGNMNFDNDHPDLKFFPASHPLPNILSVAATDIWDRLDIRYSNYGAKTVHLAAPGSFILSTFPLSGGGAIPGYRFLTGTSMAAPHVTGAAALVMSKNPKLSHLQTKTAILQFADRLANLKEILISGARLNLHRTLQFLNRIAN